MRASRHSALLLTVQFLSILDTAFCKTMDAMQEARFSGPWFRELMGFALLGGVGWAAYLLSQKAFDDEAEPTRRDGESPKELADSSPQAPHVKVLDLASGVMARSNSNTVVPFDAEAASGCYCLLHRPLDGDMASDPYADYFRGKVRLWEVRLQLRFKEKVEASAIRLGTSPLERIPVGVRQVALHRSFIGLMGSALQGFYNSPGDDPTGRRPADVEPPITSVPIYAADQHIETGEAEAPPKLLDPAFPSLGVRKTADRAGFKAKLAPRVFQPGEVHTFAFWGPSRLVNMITWQVVGLPMWSELSLDIMNGPPPIILSMYILGPPVAKPNGEMDTRHLPARTKIVARACGWSSIRPPPPRHMQRMREMATRPLAGHREAGLETPGSRQALTPASSSSTSACFGWFPRGYLAWTCNSWLTCGVPRGAGSPTAADDHPRRDASVLWASRGSSSFPSPRRMWSRR